MAIGRAKWWFRGLLTLPMSNNMEVLRNLERDSPFYLFALFSLPGQTIFTTTCIFGGTYFFYLATQWRRIITSWLEHERIFLHPPYSNKIKGNFVRKIHAIAFITILLALIDHYIYIGSAIERVNDQIASCDEHQRDFWKNLYINERQVFYTFLPYYSWQIPFMEVYEVVKALCWTYSEVFINAMSITLAARFQQLTNRLKGHGKQHLGDNYWHEIRSHYNILCNLVLKADQVLSPFLLVYCFSNMFFLCQKLFTQFESNRKPWERYYSYYSSVFLIIRTVGMLCFGASVNEKSRAALRLMREVPNKSFAGLDVITSLDSNFDSNPITFTSFVVSSSAWCHSLEHRRAFWLQVLLHHQGNDFNGNCID